MDIKGQGHVPSHNDMTDQKQMAFERKSERVTENLDSTQVYVIKLAWWTKRHDRYELLEKDLRNELQQQHQLTGLLGKEQTKQGFERIVAKINSVIELDVEVLHPSDGKRDINSFIQPPNQDCISFPQKMLT